MRLTLADDDRPLYRQIASAVRHEVAAGRLAPGERLPAGRDLAVALDVNLDTVQRAYRLLADEGVVVARVGRGTRIADDPPLARLALVDDVDTLIGRARSVGLGVEDLVTMLRDQAEPRSADRRLRSFAPM